MDAVAHLVSFGSTTVLPRFYATDGYGKVAPLRTDRPDVAFGKGAETVLKPPGGYRGGGA